MFNLPRIALDSFRFAEPLYLWLLVLPAVLFVVWTWRLVRRRGDLKRMRASRALPIRERLGAVGDLAFWAAVLVATALCIVALARPQALVSTVRKASADVVVLQDASASMYVSDVRPDRWRRSVQFLRTFAETLSWEGDRVALALFAQLAAPQVRLTKDPNALFFFIDHLGDHSPFRLENTTTWDTNIEEGIRWGLRLVEKDEEVFGKNGNPKAFLVISDGQAWSGTVATAIQNARAMKSKLAAAGYCYVVMDAGWFNPEPERASKTETPRVILDEHGRLLPAPERFPSSRGGVGLRLERLAIDEHAIQVENDSAGSLGVGRHQSLVSTARGSMRSKAVGSKRRGVTDIMPSRTAA